MPGIASSTHVFTTAARKEVASRRSKMRIKTAGFVRGISVAFAAAITTAAMPAVANDLVIHAGRLFDGVSKTQREKMSIIVRDDRIVEVRPGFVTPDGAKVIDLSTRTVMPGLIDMHMHIAPFFGTPVERFYNTAADTALNASATVRKILYSGFTTVRNMGDRKGVDVALKRAIDRGVIIGPRIWPSLEAIGPTGGHSDGTTGYDPQLTHPGWGGGIADGVDAMLYRIRDHHKRGAKVIKLMPSGGVGSVGDDPTRQTMTNDEIKAAVEAAHALGLKVGAHAHSKQALDNAVRAGVDTIEHGTYGDAESFALMKKHGTYLVPTLYLSTLTARAAREAPGNLNPGSAEKALVVVQYKAKMLAAAYKAGVKIAFGSDTAGTGSPAWNLPPDTINVGREFVLLVENGMTPADALMAATANAADAIGASQEIGSIQPGRYADIIAVPGDPYQDITLMKRVDFVMKGGVAVRTPNP